MTVTQIAVPDDVRALSTLGRVDYTDAFLVDTCPGRSAEEAARATLEGVPLGVRARLYLGWTALGLRLGPPVGADRVLGWRIEQLGPDAVVLRANGRLGFGLRGELLFRRDPETERLLFATFVQLGNPVVRRIWARITAHHQKVVRSLLTHAARRAGTA